MVSSEHIDGLSFHMRQCRLLDRHNLCGDLLKSSQAADWFRQAVEVRACVGEPARVGQFDGFNGLLKHAMICRCYLFSVRVQMCSTSEEKYSACRRIGSAAWLLRPKACASSSGRSMVEAVPCTTLCSCTRATFGNACWTACKS